MAYRYTGLWWRLVGSLALWSLDVRHYYHSNHHHHPTTRMFCEAVLRGDEVYADREGGRFWTFHSAGVSIVNADTCRVEHTFAQDAAGRPLPDAWHDGVYMEHRSSSSSSSGSSSSQNQDGYVLINSGVTRYGADDDVAMGEVLVFATHPRWYPSNKNGGPGRLRVEIDGGGRHYESYGVNTRNEYWTASGHNNGTLFILHLEDLAVLIESGRTVGSTSTSSSSRSSTQRSHVPTQQIQLQVEATKFGITNAAGAEEGIRGQLLWNEDSHLGSVGVATSREQVIHMVDLDSKQPVGLFNYSQYLDDGECRRGARGIAFDHQNRHLFVECTWDGPTLELDLTDLSDPRFIAKHNVSGWLEEEPNSGLVVASDRRRNLLHIFLPGDDQQSSSTLYQINVPGRPDMPSFFEKNVFETVVCMPLTENVNRNNLDAEGNIACDSYSCGPPESPQDVAAGMCLYDNTTNNMELLRVRLEDFDKVVNEEAPYNNRCPRCKRRDSYHGGDICTCTPHCGSCADPDYDASQTGVRCFDLNTILDREETVESTLVAGAGAIQQSGPNFWQPQCSYGWTHRSSKRGGRYHASVAHYPSNSLQIVDMWTKRRKCQVDLPGKPDRVIYVPPQPSQLKSFEVTEHEDDIKAGIITLIVFGCVAAVVMIVTVLQYSTRGSASLRNTWDTGSTIERSASDLELSPQAVEQKAGWEQSSGLPAIT